MCAWRAQAPATEARFVRQTALRVRLDARMRGIWARYGWIYRIRAEANLIAIALGVTALSLIAFGLDFAAVVGGAAVFVGVVALARRRLQPPEASKPTDGAAPDKGV